jgi:hypothetical protein
MSRQVGLQPTEALIAAAKAVQCFAPHGCAFQAISNTCQCLPLSPGGRNFFFPDFDYLSF